MVLPVKKKITKTKLLFSSINIPMGMNKVTSMSLLRVIFMFPGEITHLVLVV